jgi:1,4-alpha-glucan branching enzyme
MMIAKRKMARGKVRVTFTMPALEEVQQLNLVGDFNNWSETSTPMTRDKDANWTATLSLDSGRDYQFRYLADGCSWHNDWAADAYVPNEHGSDNSVISLKDGALPTAKKPTRRKAG